MSEQLPAIPFVDIRDGGPPRHARENPAQARALRDSCLAIFPAGVQPLVPALDWLSRQSLKRSRSPYVGEVADIAEALGVSGVWVLNASYQWGCTARATEEDGVPWLARTLDWPFRGLGRHTELARMCGDCGDFVSATWPGYVGVLTAMAPQRFAGAVNQAPMRRRTRHRYLRPYDYFASACGAAVGAGRMPPDQLLRYVFETCADFAAARRMLETTPIGRPVIYTLVGCAKGERCIIERTETEFVTREANTSAANDWVPRRPDWEGRIGTRRFFICSFDDAGRVSDARRDCLAEWQGSFATGGFGWVREPVLNPYTRVAVAMSPAHGILRAIGYDTGGAGLPEPVTQASELQLLSQSGYATAL
jgi:hypothetical protein